jgi:hypothetical protein
MRPSRFVPSRDLPPILLAAVLSASILPGAEMSSRTARSQPVLRKMTPILQVERIEPSLPFWRSLGFEVSVEVPHEDRLGFVILARGGLEVMMQTIESMRADDASLAPERATPTYLFVEVEDLEATRAALVDAEPLLGPRDTFYGMREVFVREPGGNVVGLAQPITTP